MNADKLPISAIIVSLNEGHLLERCLSKLFFCEEVVLVDLESTDSTEEIGKLYATKVIRHERVPLVEIILNEFIPKVKHDWILMIDPDEVLSDGLIDELIKQFPIISDNVGMINCPYLFYFGERPIYGTRWGGIRSTRLLAHRERIHYSGNVHKGQELKTNYKRHKIKYKKDVLLHHFWMTGREQFLEKHTRYLLKEGKSLYEQGKKYGLLKQLFHSVKGFFYSYFIKLGVREGYLGLYLSVFWSWYVFMRWDSLREFEKGIKNSSNKT